MNQLIRLTGLWRAMSQAGQEYLSGDVSPSARLVIMPNVARSSSKEPEFIAYLAPAGYQEASQKAAPAKEQEQDEEEDGYLYWWQK